MELTDSDLSDLAAFFGRRLDVRLTPTPAARTDAQARQRAMAWLLTLEEAQDRGHLSALLLKISRRFPDDPNLQEACALLIEPGRSSDRAAGLVFLAAGAAGVAGLLASGVGLTAAVVTGFIPPAEPTFTSLTPAIEVVGNSPVDSPIRHESAAPVGRCTNPDAAQVGYWYAGSQYPGGVGSTVPFDRAVNVRVDYPDHHNRFDARSHIECVIQPGDRVRISREPVLVPGNRYWVPLVSGDLVAPKRTASAPKPETHSG